MLTVEQALHAIHEKAALLEYLSGTAARYPIAPDSAVLQRIGTICAEIDDLAQRIKAALPLDALESSLAARAL